MARRRRKRIPRLPFGRLLGPPLSIAFFLAIGYLAMSGRLKFLDGLLGRTASTEPNAATQDVGTAYNLVSADGNSRKAPQSLRIASFNIQIFGEKKSQDAEVMKNLALILRQFDVIAVQEIRSKSREPVDRLVKLVNSEGNQYQVILSERLGRTSSKEQYAFIWDSTRVQLVDESAYVVDDGADFMHREPFVASFHGTVPTPGSQPFSFTLINVHTDPDETVQELNVLDDVFQSVRAYEMTEDDVMIVGDLNVEIDKLGELGQIQGIQSLNREKTNTAGSRMIDHILVDRYATTEVRAAGVINFERDLQVSREVAERISDHRPVWAEFDVAEHAASGMIATRPGTSQR